MALYYLVNTDDDDQAKTKFDSSFLSRTRTTGFLRQFFIALPSGL
jgi:hypothetical protein